MKQTLMIVGAFLATISAARECWIETSVSQGNTPGCSRCPPVVYYRGTAQFWIDDDLKWEEVGNSDQYDALSNGDGYFYEHEEGLSFHIRALGIPALQDEPSCRVNIGDDLHKGEGSSEHTGGVGGLKDKLMCKHVWEC